MVLNIRLLNKYVRTVLPNVIVYFLFGLPLIIARFETSICNGVSQLNFSLNFSMARLFTENHCQWLLRWIHSHHLRTSYVSHIQVNEHKAFVSKRYPCICILWTKYSPALRGNCWDSFGCDHWSSVSENLKSGHGWIFVLL